MRKGAEFGLHRTVGLVSCWRNMNLCDGWCNVRRVLMNHVVMLSTDDVAVTVSNDMIVMIDVIIRRRVINRILVNDIMMLSTNDMAVAVPNDVIVVVDVITRLVNRIVTVLPERVTCQKCRTSDYGQNV